MAQYRITAEFVREFNRIRTKLDNLRGENVKNTPEAISIGGSAPTATPTPSDGEELWVYKINGQCVEPGTFTANGYRADLTSIDCPTAALDMLGGLSDPIDILVVNAEENGLSPAHWLENNSVGFGIRRGTDSDGWPIVITQGGRYRTSGGATLGEAGIKASFVAAADGDPDAASWARDTSDAPLQIWLPTDFRSDPGSADCNNQPPKFWGYKRLFTQDAGGRLHAVSGEVGTILATGCCPTQTTISSPTFASVDEAQSASVIHNTIAISGLL